MMPGKRWLAATMGLAVGLVVAGECVFGGGVTPPVSITLSNLSAPAAWNQIADRLSGLGNLFKDLEGAITIPVQLPGGFAPVPVHMGKICGQTLQQAALEVAVSAERMLGGGGASSGGGTGTTTGIIGWSPVYMTGMVCAGDVCRYDTVLVGYEPIYGPIPGERQYTDKVT